MNPNTVYVMRCLPRVLCLDKVSLTLRISRKGVIRSLSSPISSSCSVPLEVAAIGPRRVNPSSSTRLSQTDSFVPGITARDEFRDESQRTYALKTISITITFYSETTTDGIARDARQVHPSSSLARNTVAFKFARSLILIRCIHRDAPAAAQLQHPHPRHPSRAGHALPRLDSQPRLLAPRSP